MAAQMLVGLGFSKVFNVSGGIQAWKEKKAIGPQDLGMNLFSGTEEPRKILKVAYSLEQGLRHFYLSMQEKTTHDKVKSLFGTLSDIEIKHQMSIFLVFKDLCEKDMGKTDFERKVESSALEGGLTTAQYFELFDPDLSSEASVISIAMSIEVQALDLYQRVAQKIQHPASKKIVNQIANEEKVHLKHLGELMDSL